MNNRIIKFRAWIPKIKKMGEVLALTPDRLQVSFKTKGGETTVPVGISEVDLMQFTGLYDKNEKEIYEGDVIKTSNKIIFTVEIPDIFYKMANGAWSEYDFEIIGNVYENPDLLVKNKK